MRQAATAAFGNAIWEQVREEFDIAPAPTGQSIKERSVLAKSGASNQALFKQIPAVDALLTDPALHDVLDVFPPPFERN